MSEGHGETRSDQKGCPRLWRTSGSGPCPEGVDTQGRATPGRH